MAESDDTGSNEQKAVAKGRGSLAINAAQYANVTVYQYVTYAGDKVTVRETTDLSRCPYPGLETYRTSEAKYFAGREDDVAELEAKLRDHDICGVIAASGAGKSSLVHAGLIPALAERETEAWDVFAFKPGQEPLYGFARSMSGVLAEAETRKGQFDEIDATVADLRETPGRLRRYIEDISRRADAADGKHHRVLIFVDQWEELYTRENDEDRDFLVRELMDVAERGLAKVLLTMRIDFMKEMLQLSPDLFKALKPSIHYVESMNEIGLRSAIQLPASEVGLEVPEDLTSRLIADLGKGRDHGSLPYLQFVLRQLWEKRDKETNSLTTEAYDEMRGLTGAIGAHADDEFRKLSKEEQGLAKRVLPRLANVSEVGAITSRRLPFADFDEPARNLLRKLAEPERRLIVLSSATEQVADAEIVAEVAHEALLDDWKTLSGWIADRKDFFRLRNKLEADAKTWVENDKNPEFLIPSGKPLFDAYEFRDAALVDEISGDLNGYLNISSWKSRSRRWTRNGVFIALLLVAFGAAVYFAELNTDLKASNAQLEQQTELASKARSQAETNAGIAELARLEAERQTEIAVEAFREVKARQLATEARDISRDLSGLIAQERAAALAIESYKLRPSSTAYQTIAASMARLPVFSSRARRSPSSIAISPDSTTIAIGRRSGPTSLFDIASGTEIDWMSAHKGARTIAFSPNGEFLATGGRDGKARVFDIASRTEIAKLEHDDDVVTIAFSPDSNFLATGSQDDTARILDIASGRETRLDHGGNVNTVAFSPDSKLLATGSRDDTARVFDLISGLEIAQIAHSHSVRQVVFSNSGRLFATVSGDLLRVFALTPEATFNFWELMTGEHRGIVNSLAFSPNGSYIATGSNDNNARLFHTGSEEEIARIEHGQNVTSVSFSVDGAYFATGSEDGTARLFDTTSQLEIARKEHNGSVESVHFSPNGKAIATLSKDRSVRMFPIDSGAEISLLNPTNSSWFGQFSPDWSRLVMVGWDNTVRVLDASSGVEFVRKKYDVNVLAAEFSPDSKRLAIASSDQKIRVFDMETGAMSATIHAGSKRDTIVFSPTGERLASIDYSNQLRFFNTSSGQEIVSPTVGQETTSDEKIVFGGVDIVAFSPDGRHFATGNQDNTVRLFDSATNTEISRIGHGSGIIKVSFSSDGSRLATLSAEGTAVLSETVLGEEVARLNKSDEINTSEISKITSIKFDPSGFRLATGDENGTVRLIDTQNGAEAARIELGAAIREVTFGPKGSRLITIERGGKLRLFDTASASELTGFEIEDYEVAAVSSNGLRLVAGLENGTTIVLDKSTGVEVFRSENGVPVTSVALSPNGEILAIGHESGTARIFDVPSGLEIAKMTFSSAIQNIWITQGGEKIVLGSRDGETRLFNITSEHISRHICNVRKGRNLSQSEWDRYIGQDQAWSPTCTEWEPSGVVVVIEP